MEKDIIHVKLNKGSVLWVPEEFSKGNGVIAKATVKETPYDDNIAKNVIPNVGDKGFTTTGNFVEITQVEKQ